MITIQEIDSLRTWSDQGCQHHKTFTKNSECPYCKISKLIEAFSHKEDFINDLKNSYEQCRKQRDNFAETLTSICELFCLDGRSMTRSVLLQELDARQIKPTIRDYSSMVVKTEDMNSTVEQLGKEGWIIDHALPDVVSLSFVVIYYRLRNKS